MKHKVQVACCLFVSILIVSGCASYKGGARADLRNDTSVKTVTAENHMVSLVAKPVHAVDDLTAQFGEDTLKYGILPVQLGIKNKSSDITLFVDPRDFSIANPTGSSRYPMTLEQIMSYTNKSYGRTVGWGIAFGLIGAAASAANVHHVNKKMRAGYDGQMLKNATLAPEEMSDGVAFFQIPEELDSLDGWKVFARAVDAQGTEYPVSVAIHGAIAKREKKKVDTDVAIDAH